MCMGYRKYYIILHKRLEHLQILVSKANEISHECQGTNILPNKKTQLKLTVLSLNEGLIIYWSNH